MINKYLAGLDNGGYEIHYDQPKLSNSDDKVGKKYTAFLLMHSGSNKLFRIFKIEGMKIEDVR
jgi:hypothetical protein